MGSMQSRVGVSDVSPPASPRRATTRIVTEERSTNKDLDFFVKEYHKGCIEILSFLPDLKDKAELLAHRAGGNPDPELEKLREFIYELTLPSDRLNSTIHELELRAIKTWSKLLLRLRYCSCMLGGAHCRPSPSPPTLPLGLYMMPLKQYGLTHFGTSFRSSAREKKRGAVAKIEKENSMAIDGLKKIREMVESLEDLEKRVDPGGHLHLLVDRYSPESEQAINAGGDFFGMHLK